MLSTHSLAHRPPPDGGLQSTEEGIPASDKTPRLGVLFQRRNPAYPPPTRSEFLAAQQTRYLEQPEACTAAHRIPQQKQKARQP